jgi:multiple antibiotic resistance protein
MAIFLLAFSALFSIVNPIGNAFIFLSATRRFGHAMRAAMARWVAIYSFAIVTGSVYIGAYVLTFFGISVPVLRVAGGIVIALAAWKMLNSEDDMEPSKDAAAAESLGGERLHRMTFYPLTMPLTTGPGTITVAVSLGTNRPRTLGEGQMLSYFVQMTLATLLLCEVIYLLYRYADAMSRVLGATGTSVITRLSAFLLFCIGIQIFWNGAAELLGSLPR